MERGVRFSLLLNVRNLDVLFLPYKMYLIMFTENGYGILNMNLMDPISLTPTYQKIEER